jgi:hypothetical protein
MKRMNSQAAMGGGGGEQRTILRDNKPKKMGARSARALSEAETR